MGENVIFTRVFFYNDKYRRKIKYFYLVVIYIFLSGFVNRSMWLYRQNSNKVLDSFWLKKRPRFEQSLKSD